MASTSLRSTNPRPWFACLDFYVNAVFSISIPEVMKLKITWPLKHTCIMTSTI